MAILQKDNTIHLRASVRTTNYTIIKQQPHNGDFTTRKHVIYTAWEQTTAAKWKMDMYKGGMRNVFVANNRIAVGLLIGQALERKRQPCLKGR